MAFCTLWWLLLNMALSVLYATEWVQKSASQVNNILLLVQRYAQTCR